MKTYRHLHNPVVHKRHGSLTISFTQKGQFIECGFALCSPSDNFCRRTGRVKTVPGVTKRLVYIATEQAHTEAPLTLVERVFYHLRDMSSDRITDEGDVYDKQLLGVIKAYRGLDDWGLGR